MRLLEIGSGSGLLAGFLREQGFDIVGLEPGAGPGFKHMQTMFEIVKANLKHAPEFELTRASITELSPDKHGAFDLIFSVNVLEHIPPIEEGFAAMARVLAPAGQMIHICPNYTVPYEPHFSIPLVPRLPGLSKLLFLSKVKEAALPGIWEDLNWITVGRARRYARDNGLTIQFEKGSVGEAMRRIQVDPIFASRHGPVLKFASKALDRIGLLDLIDKLPPSLISPMTFRMRHARK
jgi:SAM-dependent methyltransferase